MPRVYEIVLRAEQLELAVRSKTPATLAQTFAAHVGVFYDRSSFDCLARWVSSLYDDEQAACFRRRLDRRLCDRHDAPVAWDLDPEGPGEAP